jgi:hypothetical protein
MEKLMKDDEEYTRSDAVADVLPWVMIGLITLLTLIIVLAAIES